MLWHTKLPADHGLHLNVLLHANRIIGNVWLSGRRDGLINRRILQQSIIEQLVESNVK